MSIGPVFFDLVDASGNGLALGGTASTAWAWNLGAYSNFMIVPEQASDLMSSAYSYAPLPSRTYFDGGNWLNSNNPTPPPAITLVAGDSCESYYVMKNGQYLQSTPTSTDRTPVYSTNKYQWKMKKTAGQAFQLQNADGSYVVAAPDGFSKTSTAALGTIFEFVNNYIVVYNSLNVSGAAPSVMFLTVDVNGKLAVQPLNNILGLLTNDGNGKWNANPGATLRGSGFVVTNTTTTTPSPLTGSTDASAGAIVVAPALSLVDPTKLFMYAACNLKIFGPSTALVTMPYVNPTPYTFTYAADCSNTNLYIGIGVGVGVFLLIIIIWAAIAARKKTKA